MEPYAKLLWFLFPGKYVSARFQRLPVRCNEVVPRESADLGPLLDRLKKQERPTPNLDTFDYSSLGPGKE